MKTIRPVILGGALGALFFLSGCKTYEDLPRLADFVDMDQFMGKWYVHGYTPTSLDGDAHNATETYEMDEDGRILTTYQFLKGGFDGKQKTYHPVGKVTNTETNAEWRMRFFSVITAPYLVLYVDPEYQYTLIGHPNLKMAWLMSRSSEISEEKYAQLVAELEERNFNLGTFARVPQRWPDEAK